MQTIFKSCIHSKWQACFASLTSTKREFSLYAERSGKVLRKRQYTFIILYSSRFLSHKMPNNLLEEKSSNISEENAIKSWDTEEKKVLSLEQSDQVYEKIRSKQEILDIKVNYDQSNSLIIFD